VQATRFQNRVLLRHGHRLLSWLLALPDTTLTAGGTPVTPQGGPVGAIEYMAFISVSDDGGQTWRQSPPEPSALQPHPTLDDRGRLLVLDDGRLWISADNGATWTARLMQAPAELRLAMLVGAVPGALYALAGPVDVVGAPSTLGPLTLLRSTDGGA